MQLTNRFSVAAPAATVYDALIDPRRVGPCIPGATIGARAQDGTYPTEIVVKLGPMRMTYRGTSRIVEEDADARRAVLATDVKEARGQGAARATMTMHVHEAGDGAEVESSTDVQLTGRAAQMGGPVIQDVAARMVQQMADNLNALLAQPDAGAAPAGTPTASGITPAGPRPPLSASPAAPGPRRVAPPVDGLRLLGRVLLARLARLFHRRGRRS